MLKDITLGQYFPGDTAIHRLDPRVKIVLTVEYIVLLFLAKWFFSYGLILLFLVCSAITAHIGAKTLMSGFKPLIIIIIVTAVLNILYTPGEPLVSFWKISITKEGISTAFFMVLRILLLVCGTFLLTYTTSPIRLTDGMESLLKPLKKIKVPVHELAMMMSIALRFIPTLIEETDKIISAQKARGADFTSGNIIRRAKALVPILVPLFVSAFRRADELATAMECRCYNNGENRTKLNVLVVKRADYAAIAVGVVLLAGTLIFRHYGL
ncbi:MAG: energy-coupling factor transporter transmembrane protein EcfT [Oscillospiraceae bacterium]|nr:energy-coupling factor transporter transmembrane protein EcfT [Oscillospiraceae bacterium]